MSTAKRELTEAQIDFALRLVCDPEAVSKSLPQAEQDEYRRCTESIIEARRSAQANEGHTVIGGCSHG